MAQTTVKDVRKLNRSLILKEFYFNGPVTRLDVSRVTKLSPATVTNIVTELIENGILVEEGSLESAGGRPSVLLKVNPDLGYFIGIEIGESFIHTELFDINFLKIGQDWINNDSIDISPEQLVTMIVESINRVMSEAGLTEVDILGIGLGVPGIVEPEEGVSIFAPNWGWANINIEDLLREKINIPIYIDNGAKALSVAELLFGQGQDVRDFIVLLIGSGIGGAILHDALILRGKTNGAGEVGHMTLAVDGPTCRCGSRGCLEVFVGAEHLVKKFHTASTPKKQVETLSAYFKNYASLTAAEKSVIQEAMKYLGAGIANLINIENPERIILGGWLGILYGNADLDLIKHTAEQFSLPQSNGLVDIRVSNLGDSAIPMGAAAMALIDFFENVNQETLVFIGGNRLKK